MVRKKVVELRRAWLAALQRLSGQNASDQGTGLQPKPDTTESSKRDLEVTSARHILLSYDPVLKAIMDISSAIDSPKAFLQKCSDDDVVTVGKDQFTKIKRGEPISIEKATQLASSINELAAKNESTTHPWSRVTVESLAVDSATANPAAATSASVTPMRYAFPSSDGTACPRTQSRLPKKRTLAFTAKAATVLFAATYICIYNSASDIDKARDHLHTQITRPLNLVSNRTLHRDNPMRLALEGIATVKEVRDLGDRIIATFHFDTSYTRSWNSHKWLPLFEQMYPNGRVTIAFQFDPSSQTFKPQLDSCTWQLNERDKFCSGDWNHHSNQLVLEGLLHALNLDVSLSQEFMQPRS